MSDGDKTVQTGKRKREREWKRGQVKRNGKERNNKKKTKNEQIKNR